MFSAVCAASLYGQNLAEAQKAIEAEQYEKARTILEQLSTGKSADGEVFFRLGDLYLTLGEDALAEETFNKGLTMKKNPLINYIGLGHLLLNAGKKEQAQADFTRSIPKVSKKTTKELVAIAKAYIDTRYPDYEKAAGYAQQAVDFNNTLAQGYLALGDAKYNLDKASDAYMAYRNAYTLDNSLLRAKLHLAVITKKANAFPEAVEMFEELISSNPEYGPTYREMAETYYLWSLLEEDKSKREEHIAKALSYYKSYMDHTDYSLNSRMRHADFLILTRDYESLEKEANEMKRLDDVNPRIWRYLGFSAYENGHYSDAASAIYNFIDKVDTSRVVGIDYSYLARAEAKLAISGDALTIDEAHFDKMLDALRKGVSKKAAPGAEFSELASKLYRTRQSPTDYTNYNYAARLYEELAAVPDSRTLLTDNYYFANAVFYYVSSKTTEEQAGLQEMMNKADAAYGVVIEGAPTTQDAYFNRARLNWFILGDAARDKSKECFEQYIGVVTEKGEVEMAKATVKSNLSTAYDNIGRYYFDSDKPKAIENLEKALEYNPDNSSASFALDFLKKEVAKGHK
ncbi:MAG: tetratricopeptide repeat protein [Rikenellaceae bacterium]|nr:tetratricopeptide repeat protein [Rikenellaceae bacterium]